MPRSSADNRMDARTSTLCDLFEQPVQFVVPEYQRKYVWNEEDQWEPLWDDLQTLAEKVLDGSELDQVIPHFMGAIVVMPRETIGSLEVLDIVDGQQRLITLQLVLDAAHACVKRGTNVHRLLSALVANAGQDTGNSRYDLKAWPSEEDSDAFIHAMRDELSTEKHNDSSIAQAHNYFTGKIREWVASGPQAEPERASALSHVLVNLLQVVSIKLAATDDAQLIFETLNARGTPLGTFDLLKNYIHRAASKQGLNATTIHRRHLRPLDGKWWDQQTGSGRLRKSRIDSLLSHWLMMKTGETSTSITKVFAGIRVYIESERQGDVETVTEELGRAAQIYFQFHSARYDFAEFSDYIRRWRTIRGDAFTPLLLWLWCGERPMSNTQRGRALRALDSLLVRRLVCGLPTRGYGDLCRELLMKVRVARTRSPDTVIIGELQRRQWDAHRWPTDKQFRDAFAQPNKLTASRRRMILEALECSLSGSRWRKRSAELASLRGMTIEHVMPRQFDTAGYRGPGIHAHGGNPELVESFGNLTLLERRLNSSLSNQSWTAKSHAYLNESKYDLALNRDLVRGGGRRQSDQLGDWTDREIRRRAKRLGNQAIKIWPRGPAL